VQEELVAHERRVRRSGSQARRTRARRSRVHELAHFLEHLRELRLVCVEDRIEDELDLRPERAEVVVKRGYVVKVSSMRAPVQTLLETPIGDTQPGLRCLILQADLEAGKHEPDALGVFETLVWIVFDRARSDVLGRRSLRERLRLLRGRCEHVQDHSLGLAQQVADEVRDRSKWPRVVHQLHGIPKEGGCARPNQVAQTLDDPLLTCIQTDREWGSRIQRGCRARHARIIKSRGGATASLKMTLASRRVLAETC